MKLGKIPVLDIMAQYGDIKARLERLNPQDERLKDISQQLAVMIYAGFIRNYTHSSN